MGSVRCDGTLGQPGHRDLPTPGSAHRHLESTVETLAPWHTGLGLMTPRHQRHRLTPHMLTSISTSGVMPWCNKKNTGWFYPTYFSNFPSICAVFLSFVHLCRFLCQVLASINWSPTTMKFYESQSVLIRPLETQMWSNKKAAGSYFISDKKGVLAQLLYKSVCITTNLQLVKIKPRYATCKS